MKPEYSYAGFEPNFKCVTYLQELIEINAFSDYQVFPIGLSDIAMCLPLFRGKGNETDCSASIVRNLRPDREFDIDMVPCFTFDEVRKSMKLETVNFIKIDVEGAELEAVTGMINSINECKPVILW